MTPPCRTFPSSTIEAEIQTDLHDKKRKLPPGVRDVDLARCALMGMLQYECEIDRPQDRNSPVRCWPVQRWFRRCQDRNGSFMVETTAWEEQRQQAGFGAPGATPKAAAPDEPQALKARER